ncbi:MAG: glycosyl hydrolase family 18 protein [Cytophagales bacterium]|nr:glycosyl hydrolase family 18 protein [Cytophagales bacterium]
MMTRTKHKLGLYLALLCHWLFSSTVILAQVKNHAMDFPGGASDLVNMGDIDQLDGATAFTFEAWVKVDAWVDWSSIFEKSHSASDRVDIQLGLQSNERLYFHVADGGNNYVAVNNAGINDGDWHHIAMAYDGTQSAYNQIDIFIDGVSVSKWYLDGNGILPSSTPNTSADFVLGRKFKGKIDEVRLWSVRLTADELVLNNTLNANHSQYANLVGYWKMDQAQTNVIVDYKANLDGSMTGGLSKVEVTDNDGFSYNIVSAYIRPQFYEAGAVDDEYLRNNNDIIHIFASPYADGELFSDFPVSDGTLTNASHLSAFAGRNGVLDLNGPGAKMNGGRHLMNLATGGATNFSFEAWVYLDSWVNWSYIFRKQGSSWLKKIDLQLGGDVNTQQLYFHVNDGSNAYAAVNNSGLTVGSWHHVGLVYRGNACANEQVKIYIDGVEKNLWYSSGNGTVPTAGPAIRDDLELGIEIDGKMDEVMVFRVPLAASNIVDHMNNGITSTNWPNNQATAYWKFDDVANPGKDSKSWANIHNSINSVIDGYEGIEHRLGVAAGDWQTMMASSTARQNFANNVRSLMDQYDFDGVDLDFEWCGANDTQCWNNYGSTITVLKNLLHAHETYSVTLHPLYYHLPASAHSVVDYISIQSYGPSAVRFPYDEFVSNIQLFLNYGYPKEKLIAGLPFYGVSDPKKLTIGYTGIVNNFPSLDPATDTVNMLMNVTNGSGCSATTAQENVTIVFNGQHTIRQKTAYANSQGLAGIMYWDTATDLDYSDPKCLLHSLNAVMNANIQIPVATGSSARISSHLTTEDLVEKLEVSDGIRIYPNPLVGDGRLLKIDIPSLQRRTVNVQLLDVKGKVILDRRVKMSDRATGIELRLNAIHQGVYILKVDGREKKISQKIIVK